MGEEKAEIETGAESLGDWDFPCLLKMAEELIKRRYVLPRSEMEKLSAERQPVDAYVVNVLKYAKDKYNLNINPENPTRGERTEAAIALRNEGESAKGYYSLELMIGRRVDSTELLALLLFSLGPELAKIPDKEYEFLKSFYLLFPHRYWPNK